VPRRPLRHVTRNAIALRQHVLAGLVAALADLADMIDPRKLAVRLVAVEAEQLRAALAEAAALFEPVRRVVDLEALALRHLGIEDIELQQVVGQRLARPE